ncbi:MAG: histone deacetylase [Candidatus Woesearchaeota archaeon]|jgi:acetoin utilization deacetylase AcuC-like enzyme|nr:histone deacetylase [Candidatus Woesearchaeota archaeon]MDP7180289.1 histone deacetylase [Candidatus Woesearchaeota archaeon]
MNFLYNKVFLEHDTGMHPESIQRLLSLGDLKETKLISGEPYLHFVHEEPYIAQIKKSCKLGQQLNPETMLSKGSYKAAIYAVGAAIMASKSNDFALVRPPGHHANNDPTSGFCLFNNIAIAAQKLANQNKKVLIIDIDGHCGDGTETFFYNTNKVMYLSLHQYPAFPSFGDENQIGEKEGKGFTINIPLPQTTGDDLYLKAFKQFLPVLKQFNPDVVGVSAGFDAHHKDPLLNLNLTTNTFHEVGKLLQKNFKNIFATLEGGYDIDFLPQCVHNFTDGINNKPMKYKETPTKSSEEVKQELNKRLNNLQNNLKEFWKF